MQITIENTDEQELLISNEGFSSENFVQITIGKESVDVSTSELFLAVQCLKNHMDSIKKFNQN